MHPHPVAAGWRTRSRHPRRAPRRAGARHRRRASPPGRCRSRPAGVRHRASAASPRVFRSAAGHRARPRARRRRPPRRRRRSGRDGACASRATTRRTARAALWPHEADEERGDPGRDVRRRDRRGGHCPSRSARSVGSGSRPWHPSCSPRGTRAHRVRRTTAPQSAGATTASTVFSATDSITAAATPDASSRLGSRPTSAGSAARARRDRSASRCASDLIRLPAEHRARPRSRQPPPSVDPTTAPTPAPSATPAAVYPTPARRGVGVEGVLDPTSSRHRTRQPDATRRAAHRPGGRSRDPRPRRGGASRAGGAHQRAAATRSPTVSPTTIAAPSTSPVNPPSRARANSRTPAPTSTTGGDCRRAGNADAEPRDRARRRGARRPASAGAPPSMSDAMPLVACVREPCRRNRRDECATRTTVPIDAARSIAGRAENAATLER